MSSGRRAWLVAASIGAVEALKDQGFCRWNYGIRLLQQHANNSLRAYSTATAAKKPIPVPASSMVLNKMLSESEERQKKSEESFRTVMYLSCWGPS